jgi:CoA:oxalate CoA-transferase
MGNHLSALSPAGIFKTRTGSLYIFAVQDNHWASLCTIMGRADLINDPRCIDNTARVANLPVVNGAIGERLMTLPERDDACAILREAHIPHGPILTVEQATARPHMRERRTVRTVHDRIIGDFQVPGFPMRFSGFPDELELEAPMLGEHNHHVLTNYLGYSPTRIAELERGGVLHRAPY